MQKIICQAIHYTELDGARARAIVVGSHTYRTEVHTALYYIYHIYIYIYIHTSQYIYSTESSRMPPTMLVCPRASRMFFLFQALSFFKLDLFPLLVDPTFRCHMPRAPLQTSHSYNSFLSQDYHVNTYEYDIVL